MPSAPNVPEGLAMYDPDDRHRGWIRLRDRAQIDEALAQATYVYCRVKRRGRRWNRLDSTIDAYRELQEGIVDWWTTEEEEEAWNSTVSVSEEDENS
ncbi:hypothetical protein E4U28_005932 [Claviceps purpurea]|nr:hypothetical protein E4U28_005932 [Claviceps purpurea]